MEYMNIFNSSFKKRKRKSQYFWPRKVWFNRSKVK